jgi:integrase
MSTAVVLDAAGRRRWPATLPGHHAGRVPRSKGQRYLADPSTVEEIVAVMRQTREDRHGFRVRALIVVLWRAGLRVGEALGLTEPDLDERRGSLLVRIGNGGRRRVIGMDAWGWEQLRPWLAARADLAVGALFLRHRRPHPGSGVVRRRRAGSSSTDLLFRPVCAVASRRISSATPTQSSSPARALP